jgi:hypothetical protein
MDNIKWVLKIRFFEANKILKPQFTNVNENLAKRYHEHQKNK